MLRACFAVLLACSGEPTPPATTNAPRAPAPAVIDAAADGRAATVDAAAPAATPRTLGEALQALRARDLGATADILEKRVAQHARKMKLTSDEAVVAAAALVELADREPVRALARAMPRSTVELARAVRERGMSADEAERIARYLARVVDALAFERLHVFDDNHSHVTGREWHEIDYSGEGMTWQGQRAYWAPRGVESFERASFIHAYFVGAEKLEHWKRVYRPRGKMSAVEPPR